MNLDELKVYEMAMEIGEVCWELADQWNDFQKNTIGKQMVRSADSIAANISEGYGRYHFKENKHFVFYARGSLFETKTWLVKAHNRKLVDEQTFLKLKTTMNDLGYYLNRYLKSIGPMNHSSLHEPEVEYNSPPEHLWDPDSIPFPV